MIQPFQQTLAVTVPLLLQLCVLSISVLLDPYIQKRRRRLLLVIAALLLSLIGQTLADNELRGSDFLRTLV